MALQIDLKAFSDLLTALYGAATSVESTNKNFLTQLKQLLNLQHATLIVRPPSANDAGLIYTSGEDADIPILGDEVGSYTSLYAQDPLVTLPLKKLTVIEDIMPRTQLLKNEYYQLFLKPFDIYYIAGIDWLYDKESRISIRFTRTEEQGGFGEDEKAFLELLVPHLEQSVSLGIQLRQLDSERQIYADSISKRSIGIITLNKNGAILQCNATAERYLNEGDGFKESQNKIKLNNSTENELFNKYISEALTAIKQKGRDQINALAASRDSGKAGYQIMIKPMPVDFHNESDVTPYLTVLIQDPEKNLEISVRTLMNLYQLTMSEATIAILLAEGHTTDEVATELDIKKNTVRAHLRSMFVKMGVTQQSMLVSLVLTSLASTQ
ncbi:MAG: helix-turn-helix transcriptional regulator [Ketobacteraceae bacterium]|nr:helix-turn-helix transcriptional regulator [Ketobacteraceae bacterium]